MHFDQDYLNLFQTNQMNTEEMIVFLEHVSNQDSYLQALINFEEKQTGITTPIYLKEQILSQVAFQEIQTQKATAKTYKIQLFYWGLRTAVGVAAALIFLFGVSTQIDLTSFNLPSFQTEEYSTPQAISNERNDCLYDLSRDISDGLSDGSQKITDYLNDISNKLLYGGK